MMLEKWSSLSNKDQSTAEYIKTVLKPGQRAQKSPATYRNLVA
jgi:hypothetical protein